MIDQNKRGNIVDIAVVAWNRDEVAQERNDHVVVRGDAIVYGVKDALWFHVAFSSGNFLFAFHPRWTV
jgi:hypothetical protein